MTETAAAVVREAREEDLPQILALLQQLSENGARPEDAVREASERHRTALNDLQRNPGYTLLVAEAESGVVGTCVLYVVPNLSHGAAPWAVVENVVVDERQRSHGYGELLMAEAVKRAKEAGCYRVSLMSNQRRIDAHRFYERIGFHASHKGFTHYFI